MATVKTITFNKNIFGVLDDTCIPKQFDQLMFSKYT